MAGPAVLLKTFFVLIVVDMARAVRFYRDALGFEVPVESSHWSELSKGDTVVALHDGGTEGQSTPATTLGFVVDDIAGVCDAVRTAGGTVLAEPAPKPHDGVIAAEVADTEGNGIWLVQPLQQAS